MKQAVTMAMILTIYMLAGSADAVFKPAVGNHSANPNFFKILKNSTPTNFDQVLAKL